MTSMNGGFCVVFNLKFPLPSVKVPTPEPLMLTEAEGTAALVPVSFTCPEIVVWANKEVEKIRAQNTIASFGR